LDLWKRMMMMHYESYTITGVAYVNSGENGKQGNISRENFSD
jgi:hypothetical protein